jgi:hypothetical protein
MLARYLGLVIHNTRKGSMQPTDSSCCSSTCCCLLHDGHAQIAGRYVNPEVEELVAIQCVGVPNITQSQRLEITGLGNGTLYR